MSVTKSFNLHRSFLSLCIIPHFRHWLHGISSSNDSARGLLKVICFPYHKMASDILQPPQEIRGMKVLNREAFNKSINVLSLEIEDSKIAKLEKSLSKYILKVYKLKGVQETDKENIRKILFNPNLVRHMKDFDATAQSKFEELNLTEDSFADTIINLTYDNWNAAVALKSVLPEDEPQLTSFSRIGHIIHVNLKTRLIDFKNIIGQILLDKIPNIRTVVSKTNRIESVYRNFEMELICGEPDFIATVRENGCCFKFDFSKVYWNPRLSTEHARVIESLNMRDAFIDVFCGVGPFSIPAAKRKCKVYANDLNPESMRWLNENIKANKVSNDYIVTFNKDASDFIKTDVKKLLIELWSDKYFIHKIVIAMNLPVLALTFLRCFHGLLKSEIQTLDVQFVKNHLPIVHCYFFAQKSMSMDGVKALVIEESHVCLADTEHSIHFVRDVSSTVNMYKIKLVLPFEFIFSNSESDTILNGIDTDSSLDEPKAKKICKSD